MLQAIQSSTPAVNSAKTIVAQSTATSTPFYTVPAGKVFKGHLMISANTSAQLKINGIFVINYSGSTNYWQEAIPLTLTAGTVCSSVNYTSAGVLVGIEEDA